MKAAIAAAALLPQMASSVGSGPDLVGLRLGMTPDEVMTALKARAPKEKWQTVMSDLRHTTSTGMLSPVPGGRFTAAIINDTRNTTRADEYWAYLAPVPGKERVIAIARRQNFLQERPLVDNTIAALIEKYGPPAARDPSDKLILGWSFDTAGKPRAFPQDPYTLSTICLGSQPLYQTPREVGNWSVRYEAEATVSRKKVRYEELCGATVVRARIVAAGTGGFAQALTVELIGHAAATQGMRDLDAFMQNAKAADLESEKAKAATRAKPDL